MFRLNLLGRVELVDADGAEVSVVLAQPKRLALLVYLAAAGDAPIRRDRLMGVFWPELEESRARNALNKAVHFLRQAMGEDVILSRGPDDVAVDANRLWCDVRAFEGAARSGQASEALELYRGELMPAFYIEDAGEFERWLDLERARLRRLAGRAANDLAQRRETEGQHTTAIGLARRAVELLDEDERAVRQLLELLDRLGDRAGALYAYEKFARRLAAEFGADPAAETRALIERIRSRSEPAPAAVRIAAPPPASGNEYSPTSEQALATAFRGRGYEIERVVGRGGMATVYLAHDVKHGRRVALKVLAPQVGALRLADRFGNEIRVTAQLNHPNILPLFDSGSVDGMLYYAMPYVTGESLRARLERDRQLPVEEAVAMIRALAGALGHAHAVGVVHRDIKPENILLHDGRPMLADFGIALALSSAGVERITSTGLSLGTPQYMSPEQAAGELSVGPPSDVYSLAAVGYEMLAGEPPFTGPNTQAVLARVMLEPPRPIRTIRRTVPETVEAAILRALAKHPVDRFATARAFAESLQAERVARSRWFIPWPSRRARRVTAAVAALAAAGAWSFVGRDSISGFAERMRPGGASDARRIVIADFVAPAAEPQIAAVAKDLVTAVLPRSANATLATPPQLLEARRAALLPDSAAMPADAAGHVAHRAGVPVVIDGRIHRVGDGYSVVLSATSAVDGRPLETEQASSSSSQLSATVETLALGLGKKLRRHDLAPLPDLHWRAATPSAEAYRLFVAAYHNPGFSAGAQQLEQALRIDSAFATAWSLLAYAYHHSDRPRLVLPAYQAALRHAYRMSPAERLYVEAMIAYRTARPDSAVKLFDAALRLNPSNAELHHDRGMSLRAGGRYDEAAESFGRAAAIVTSQPVARSSHLNSLASTLALNGNVDSARIVAKTIPDSSARLDAQLYVAIGAADWDEVRRLAKALETDPTTEAGFRRTLTYTRAATLVAQGQVNAARRLYPEIGPVEVHVIELALAVGTGDTSKPRAAQPRDTMTYDFVFRAARNAWRGDSEAARREARALQARLGKPGNPLSAEQIQFYHDWGAPGQEGVRRMIDYLTPQISSGTLGLSGLVRFFVADGYERLGQLDSAAAYFDLIVRPRRLHFNQSHGHGLVHSFALRRLALVYERMGEREKAKEHWEAFLRNFNSPDAELQSLVDEARVAVSRTRQSSFGQFLRRLIASAGASKSPPVSAERVLTLPLEMQSPNPALNQLASQWLTTLPEAIAREGLGEPVPASMIRDRLARATGSAGELAERLVRETGAGIQLRGGCSGAGIQTACHVDLLRMPGNVLRLSTRVAGDPADPQFAAALTERVLVALYLQRTWGDRVNWSGESVPRSLAAARAFKHACCEGRENSAFFGEAARLDTGWVAAIAMAAWDSTGAVAESIWARLSRRAGLLDGERQTIAWLQAEHGLRNGRQIEPGRLEADVVFDIMRRRATVNPEWWSTDLAYWALLTFRPHAAIAASYFADSALAPRLPRFQPYAVRGHALHQLGRFKEQLELADEIRRRFPSQDISWRSQELEALAGLGDVSAIRKRLSAWEATPETRPEQTAGSRDYIAGLELMAHGYEREGRAILAAKLPFYRRLRAAEGYRVELLEILMVTERFDEARDVALADLPKVKRPADSIGMLGILGGIALRQRQTELASHYWQQLLRAGSPSERLPSGYPAAVAFAAGWMNYREEAVRALELGRRYGRVQYRFAHREPAYKEFRDYPPFQNFLKPRD